jgi:hypothetical protein
MMARRAVVLLPLLAAAVLAGCAHAGSRVQLAEGADFARLRRIGVMPFQGVGDKGAVVAKDIEEGLKGAGYEIVDEKLLERAMAGHRMDSDFGYGLEAAADVRIQTGADAVLVGRVARDWSAAFIIMMETEMGDKVLSGVVKPEKKGEKVFKGPDELARTITGIFARIAGKAGF